MGGGPAGGLFRGKPKPHTLEAPYGPPIPSPVGGAPIARANAGKCLRVGRAQVRGAQAGLAEQVIVAQALPVAAADVAVNYRQTICGVPPPVLRPHLCHWCVGVMHMHAHKLN